MAAVPGGVPERPKGTGCKPVGSAYGGSNPPAPINILPLGREAAFLPGSGMAGRAENRGSCLPPCLPRALSGACAGANIPGASGRLSPHTGVVRTGHPRNGSLGSRDSKLDEQISRRRQPSAVASAAMADESADEIPPWRRSGSEKMGTLAATQAAGSPSSACRATASQTRRSGCRSSRGQSSLEPKRRAARGRTPTKGSIV
jgi:hypothetical protein